MSKINLAAVAEILETVIQPAVHEQFISEFIGLQMAKRETPSNKTNVINFGRDEFEIPMQTYRHSGAASIAESGTMVNGKPSLKRAKISYKTHTGSQMLTKQSLNVNSVGAVVPILTNMGKMLVDAMNADLSRQFYGTGDGVIGTASGGGSGATTLIFAASTNGDIDYAEYCPPGTQIKIGAGAVVEVTSIDDTNTVTIAGARSWSNADEIKKCEGAGAVATELTGLRTMLSNTASFQNIDPSSFPFWKPANIDDTSEQLGINGLDTTYLKAEKLGSISHILSNQTLFKRYAQTLTSLKQAATTKEVLSGGWRGIDYMGGKCEVVLDYDCPDDWMFFMSPKHLVWGEAQPMEWEKGTEGTLLRSAGKLEYEVAASMMGEFGCLARRAFGAVKNKTD